MNGIGPLDIEARRELAWACALHEIGLTVSHHQFHRHGAYLLSNVDAPGFSQSQLARIAHLVLGQRGGLRKLDLQQPNPILARQILCLRVAALKCHARREVSLDALTIEATEQRARLTYSPAWAQEHPRTLFLLNEEAEVWRRQGPTGWTLELAPNAQLATTAA